MSIICCYRINLYSRGSNVVLTFFIIGHVSSNITNGNTISSNIYTRISITRWSATVNSISIYSLTVIWCNTSVYLYCCFIFWWRFDTSNINSILSICLINIYYTIYWNTCSFGDYTTFCICKCNTIIISTNIVTNLNTVTAICYNFTNIYGRI